VRNLRHRVDVMRPTKATGTLGQKQGQDETVCKAWPCSIKTLSGKEQETARQTGADAQFEIEGYGDPKWTDLEQCYLQFGERRLNIEFVDDEQQNGIKLRLLCGENK
jgi:head-tail adaptor